MTEKYINEYTRWDFPDYIRRVYDTLNIEIENNPLGPPNKNQQACEAILNYYFESKASKNPPHQSPTSTNTGEYGEYSGNEWENSQPPLGAQDTSKASNFTPSEPTSTTTGIDVHGSIIFKPTSENPIGGGKAGGLNHWDAATNSVKGGYTVTRAVTDDKTSGSTPVYTSHRSFLTQLTGGMPDSIDIGGVNGGDAPPPKEAHVGRR